MSLSYTHTYVHALACHVESTAKPTTSPGPCSSLKRYLDLPTGIEHPCHATPSLLTRADQDRNASTHIHPGLVQRAEAAGASHLPYISTRTWRFRAACLLEGCTTLISFPPWSRMKTLSPGTLPVSRAPPPGAGPLSQSRSESSSHACTRGVVYNPRNPSGWKNMYAPLPKGGRSYQARWPGWKEKEPAEKTAEKTAGLFRTAKGVAPGHGDRRDARISAPVTVVLLNRIQSRGWRPKLASSWTWGVAWCWGGRVAI